MLDGVSGSSEASKKWGPDFNPKAIRDEIVDILEEVAALMADHNFGGSNFDTIFEKSMGKIDALIDKFKGDPEVQGLLRAGRDNILAAYHLKEKVEREEGRPEQIAKPGSQEEKNEERLVAWERGQKENVTEDLKAAQSILEHILNQFS